MTDYFHVRITFVDGTEEFIRDATDTQVKDGVLHVDQNTRGSYFSDHKRLGSYPLANIKYYKREDR